MSIKHSKRLCIKETGRFRLYSERWCFQMDQSALIQKLKFVGNAIEDGATEMAMIAEESVFDRQVSKILVGTARALRRMADGLKDLRVEVARARFREARK
jgi:hypothetical protein